MLTLIAGAAIALAWVVDTARAPRVDDPAASTFAVASAPAASHGFAQLTEIAELRIPIDPRKPTSHSSSLALAADPSGRSSLLAYWFSGSRESGPDVEILSSRYDPEQGRWSAARLAVNRHALATQLDFFVRRLGNPVAWADVEGRVHLFVVATGLGGWAASRVVHLLSDDQGLTFAVLRVLPLSPWFNTSHLVRAPATPLANGGALLPLHFEIGNKYPVALRLSPRGVPVGLVRLSHDDEALQPSIVALDPARAIALLRDHGGARSLKVVSTDDGGRSWTDRQPTNLPNPDASIAAARLPDGTLVAALNPARHGRSELVLAISRDGYVWTIVGSLAAGVEPDEFSYPSILVDGNLLHLTYTYKRERIMHRVFEIGLVAG